MTAPKHTPEWYAEDREERIVIFQPGVDREIASLDCAQDDEDQEEQLARARRIVACVNACAGLSTEALEGGALKGLVSAVHAMMKAHVETVTEDGSFWDSADRASRSRPRRRARQAGGEMTASQFAAMVEHKIRERMGHSGAFRVERGTNPGDEHLIKVVDLDGDQVIAFDPGNPQQEARRLNAWLRGLKE